MHERIDMVQSGWEVVGADDQRIGDVTDVGENYIHLTKGLLLPKDVYVPADAIQDIDSDAERVRLAISKDEVDHVGWETVPDETSGSRAGDAGTYDAYGRGRESDVRGERETTTVPVVEEQLRTERRPVDAGQVDVRKRVREEERSVDVPVTREDVEVRRRSVDRPVTSGDRITEDGDTVTIPVRGEKVDVSKEPRVVEEIEVSKRPVSETQRVTDTVRREEVDVQGQGDARVRDPDLDR